MKFTTVSIKEIQADKTHRLDAKYWINKKIEREIKRLKKLKDPDDEYIIMDLEQEKKE